MPAPLYAPYQRAPNPCCGQLPAVQVQGFLAEPLGGASVATASGFTYSPNVPSLVSSAVGGTIFLKPPFTTTSYGQVLLSIDLYWQVGNAHSGGLPAVQPTFQLVANNLTTSSYWQTIASLTLSAGTVAAYYDGGIVQTINLAMPADYWLDTTLNVYALSYQEESGTNSHSGNGLLGGRAYFNC
jgi:hypothetical protein